MSDTLEKFEFGHHRPMIFKELLPFEALSDSKATNHLKIFPSTTSKSNQSNLSGLSEYIVKIVPS